MALEMAESDNHLSASNGMPKMPFVNLACQSQGDDCRQLSPFTHAPQDRGLADRRPCGGNFGLKGKAPRIHKRYGRASTARLFLICGQSRVSQAWTNASSRSRA
jgi:hypothetical protein